MSGSQTSPDSGKPNRGGITPTISAGLPFSRTVLPTAAGSRLNCDSQIRWLMRMTGGAPGRASLSLKSRPRIGATRRSASVLGVISTPR